MSPAANPAQVSRTAAGDHEIAVPSLGLSLTQRRLLTLLDSPIAAQSLAERSGLPPEKFIRDLGRLASFRLVAGALPQDVLRGASAGDTVTRAAVAMPAAVTIRPAANAESIAERRQQPPSGRRWLAPVAVVAIVAVAAIGVAWQRWTAETSTPSSAAIRRAPTATPAVNAAQPAAQRASTPAAASAAAAPRPLASATPQVAPGAEAASGQAARRTAAERAAAAAAIVSLRRSEAQSIAAFSDPRQRAAVPAAKDRPAPAPEAAPRSAPPTASPVAADRDSRTDQTGQTAVRRADEAPGAAAGAAQAPASVPAAAPSAAPASAAASDAASPPAAAAPRSPTDAPVALAPIARVAPDFPPEAVRRRIDSGRVRARVTVDAGGHVTGVAIVSASPRGVFDDAVTAALGKWRFPPGAAGRRADVDVEFHRD